MYYRYSLLIINIIFVIILITGCKTNMQAHNEISAINNNMLEAQRLLDEGIEFNKEQKYEQALDRFSQSITVNPSFQQAYYYRGLLYYSLNRYAEAIRDFDNVIALGLLDESNYIFSIFMKGKIFNDTGEYNKALDCFNKVIQYDSSSPQIFYERGIANFHLGKMTDAHVDANFAALADSSNCDYLYLRGIVYYKQGLLHRALSDFKKSLNISPDNIEVLLNSGIVAKEMKQYDESLKYFNKIIELDKNNKKAYYERSNLYSLLVDLTDRIEEKKYFREKADADMAKCK